MWRSRREIIFSGTKIRGSEEKHLAKYSHISRFKKCCRCEEDCLPNSFRISVKISQNYENAMNCPLPPSSIKFRGPLIR